MKNDKLRVPKFNFWGNGITGGKYAALLCLRVGFLMLASAKGEMDPTICSSCGTLMCWLHASRKTDAFFSKSNYHPCLSFKDFVELLLSIDVLAIESFSKLFFHHLTMSLRLRSANPCSKGNLRNSITSFVTEYRKCSLLLKSRI